jgi:hypothetical protein
MTDNTSTRTFDSIIIVVGVLAILACINHGPLFPRAGAAVFAVMVAGFALYWAARATAWLLSALSLLMRRINASAGFFGKPLPPLIGGPLYFVGTVAPYWLVAYLSK